MSLCHEYGMKHKVIPLNNVTLDYYHDNFIKTAQAKAEAASSLCPFACLFLQGNSQSNYNALKPLNHVLSCSLWILDKLWTAHICVSKLCFLIQDIFYMYQRCGRITYSKLSTGANGQNKDTLLYSFSFCLSSLDQEVMDYIL